MDLLTRIARQALMERDFLVDFTDKELNEVNHLHQHPPQGARDLRHLEWISIDNDDTKDFDQVSFAQGNVVYVAVADVAYVVEKGSLVDLHAAHNTTSLYTPTEVFPMLPLQLSNGLTSLNPGEDRYAVVTEFEVDGDGAFKLRDIYSALVHNQAKCTYNKVTEWLENGSAAEQIQLQDELAQKIQGWRRKQGALEFESIEEPLQNRGEELIENLMIAANACMTRYFIKNGWPIFKRIVRTPKRWDRLQAFALEYGFELPNEPDVKSLQKFLEGQRIANPGNFADLSLAVIKLIGRGEYIFVKPGEKSPGHFDLALQEYAHTTAPNRRYPDLIMQRILKKVPYSDDELIALAAHCTLKEDDATKAERRIMKSFYAMQLAGMIGKQFSAVVTGVNEHGTWVRIDGDIPAEGKLIDGYMGVDVGDKVQVKLVSADVKRGFIDFVRQK